MKPTANYRMTKTTKRALALMPFKDQEQRNAWKRTMIQGELAALVQPKREKNRRENSSE